MNKDIKMKATKRQTQVTCLIDDLKKGNNTFVSGFNNQEIFGDDYSSETFSVIQHPLDSNNIYVFHTTNEFNYRMQFHAIVNWIYDQILTPEFELSPRKENQDLLNLITDKVNDTWIKSTDGVPVKITKESITDCNLGFQFDDMREIIYEHGNSSIIGVIERRVKIIISDIVMKNVALEQRTIKVKDLKILEQVMIIYKDLIRSYATENDLDVVFINSDDIPSDIPMELRLCIHRITSLIGTSFYHSGNVNYKIVD